MQIFELQRKIVYLSLPVNHVHVSDGVRSLHHKVSGSEQTIDLKCK